MRTESSEKLRYENKAVRSYMIDMLIMLTATAVVAIYTYGARSAQIIILSVISSIAAEIISYAVFMRRKPTRIADLSTVFTGLAIALAMPSSSPLWLAPLGSVVAICIAKLPFGNAKSGIFVPAAVGIAFLVISYPDLVFTYPSVSLGSLDAPTFSDGFVQGTSLAQMLTHSKSIGTNVLNVMDVFVGRVSGPMGASCFILMLATFIYMLIRRQPGFITTASFIAACSVMAVLFPRVLTGRVYSLLMELSAGLLLYSAVFFISDPTTSPKNQLGRVLYGACAGFATMLFRYFGAFEEGVCFVIIIMNAFSDLFEKCGLLLSGKVQKKSGNSSKNNTNKNNTNRKKETTHKKKRSLKADSTNSNEGGILDHE